MPKEEEKVELLEIPDKWVDVDIGGLKDFKEVPEDDDAYPLLMKNKALLLQSLYDNRNVIKVAFTYYALAGVADVEDDPSTMSMLQFTNFANGAKLTQNSKLKLSDLDLIFIRAARPLPTMTTAERPSLEAVVESSGVSVNKGWKKLRKLGLDVQEGDQHGVGRGDSSCGEGRREPAQSDAVCWIVATIGRTNVRQSEHEPSRQAHATMQ